MRRFLRTIGACLLGLIAAFAFDFLAGVVRPCTGEGLACSMTSILGFIYVPVFAVIALVCFGISVFVRNDPQAVGIAALVPLVPFLLLVAYIKFSEISVREYHEIRERDIQELLQIVIPIVLTIVVPWAVLQRFAVRAETEVKAHG